MAPALAAGAPCGDGWLMGVSEMNKDNLVISADLVFGSQYRAALVLLTASLTGAAVCGHECGPGLARFAG